MPVVSAEAKGKLADDELKDIKKAEAKGNNKREYYDIVATQPISRSSGR
jgi:hypothetical protein